MTVCEFGQKPGWPWGFCGYDCPPCTPAADSGHPAAVILVRAHGPAHPLGWGVYFLCFFSLLVRELQWVSISALGDNFFFFFSSSHQFFPLQGRRTQGSEQTFRVAGTVFLQADHGKLFRKVPGLLCKLLVGFEEENSAGRYDPLYICSPQGFALMW